MSSSKLKDFLKPKSKWQYILDVFRCFIGIIPKEEIIPVLLNFDYHVLNREWTDQNGIDGADGIQGQNGFNTERYERNPCAEVSLMEYEQEIGFTTT